jgi:hypothetical protein
MNYYPCHPEGGEAARKYLVLLRMMNRHRRTGRSIQRYNPPLPLPGDDT